MMAKLSDTAPFSAFERLLAVRYLRARRKEGFISVIAGFSFAGIMLGVATLIIVMAVMNGFRGELMSKILGFNGHAMVYHKNLEPLQNHQAIVNTLAGQDGVTRAIPFVEGQVMASSIRANTGALVRGLSEADIKKLPSVNNDKLQGTLDGFDQSGSVAIGYRMAWKHRLSIGQNLTIISPEGPDTIFGTAPRIRAYPIVAIFEIGMSEYDQTVVYMPLAEAQEYFAKGEGVTAIELMVAKPDDIDSYIQALVKNVPQDLHYVSWKRSNQTFFNALIVERNVMFLILTLIILVAALNIISGLIMLVKDKGRDIAILRTMGASRGAIQRVFFMTGAAIGVTGTVAGIVLGVVVCLNVENIRQFLSWLTGTTIFSPELYYLSRLPADMDITETLLVAAMSIGLSLLSTLYPAWRAARLDPVEALRYE